MFCLFCGRHFAAKAGLFLYVLVLVVDVLATTAAAAAHVLGRHYGCEYPLGWMAIAICY